MEKITEQDVYAVYIRVSTTMQANDGDSIEMQLNLAREYVEKNGGILPEENIYIEPAVSASKTELSKRTVLLECLDKAKKGGFNKLLVYRRDRLARKIEDSLAIRNILAKAKVDVIFTATGEAEMDLNDPYTKFFENIRASMDEIESVQTSIRVSDTMKDKAKRGEFTGGNLPYGYRLDEKGKIQFIESEREIIKEIEELYLAGYGVQAIAKWLNGEKVNRLGVRPLGKAKRLKQFKTSSEHWTKDVIKGILFNPFYTGYIPYSTDGLRRNNQDQDTIILAKGNHEVVRSVETQKLINAKRKERASKIKPPRFYNTSFLLTGLIYCKECGNKFYGLNSTRSNGTRYSYYVCGSRHKEFSSCGSPSFNKEILEEFVMKFIKNYIKQLDITSLKNKIEKQLLKENKKSEEALKNINKRIERLNKDYRAISRLLLDLDENDELYDVLKEQYQSDQKEILLKLKKAKVEKEELMEKLEVDNNQQIEVERIIERLKNFTNIIDTQPFHYKKSLLDELISKIEVDKDGNLEVSFNIQLETAKEPEESNVSFISFGGVGDTTTPKIIKLSLSANNTISDNLRNTIITARKRALKYFPKWIRYISKDEKLNPHKLHRMTGIPYVTCRYYLRKNNNTLPVKENFEKISKTFNVTLDDFIKYADIPFSAELFFDVIDSAESISRDLKKAVD